MAEDNQTPAFPPFAPEGIPSLRSIPMPADTISENYVSAGWLLSQMDLAGGKFAHMFVGGRMVTVSVDAMSFSKPVFVGDEVSIFTEAGHIGRSSLSVYIEAWARRKKSMEYVCVTTGVFKFVHTDDSRQPVEIPRDKLQYVTGRGHGAQAQGTPAALTAATAAAEDEGMADYRLSVRTVTLPRDTNYLGDIFGGWILAQMDMACLKEARRLTGTSVATVGIESMSFHLPLFVGDEVSFYTKLVRTGTTSVTFKVESHVVRPGSHESHKVTEGLFTYVAIDENRQPVAIAELSHV